MLEFLEAAESEWPAADTPPFAERKSYGAATRDQFPTSAGHVALNDKSVGTATAYGLGACFSPAEAAGSIWFLSPLVLQVLLLMSARLSGLAVVFALTLFNGCQQASHPGNWDEAMVEEKLKEKMALTSIDLTPTADGFEGTGTYADGEETEITVTQAGQRLDYDGKGNRGSNETGFYVVD